MHAIGQATKVESAYYSVESVCSAASYDKGTDEAGASKWGRQEYEQKARRFLWVMGWWEPRARWRAQRGWSGACRREVGGLGEQKGIVCCVDDGHIHFHGEWPRAAAGCCATVPWDLQRRQEVFGFWTSSHPYLVDFVSLIMS